MNELALFAGAGGGILGGKLLGWRTVCAVECDAYAAAVLAQRQNDGLLEAFPIWSDVRTFDGKPWKGIIDVISGGFPCQDISIAGKGAGIKGKRSGLWKEFSRIIGEIRPKFAFIENSPMLINRGLEVVLCDLAALGYDAKWICLSASEVGAPHKRDRFWLVGYTNNNGQVTAQECRSIASRSDNSEARPQQTGKPSRSDQQYAQLANANSARCEEQRRAITDGSQYEAIKCRSWWQFEPDVGRVAHGVAARVDRLKALGNGQVPKCAAEAWRMLNEKC